MAAEFISNYEPTVQEYQKVSVFLAVGSVGGSDVDIHNNTAVADNTGLASVVDSNTASGACSNTAAAAGSTSAPGTVASAAVRRGSTGRSASPALDSTVAEVVHSSNSSALEDSSTGNMAAAAGDSS